MADITIFDEKTFLADPLVIKAGGKEFVIADEKITTAFSLKQLTKIRDMQTKIAEMEKSEEGEKNAASFMLEMQSDFIADVLSIVDTEITPEWVKDNISSRVRPKLFEHIRKYQQGDEGKSDSKNEGSGAVAQ